MGERGAARRRRLAAEGGRGERPSPPARTPARSGAARGSRSTQRRLGDPPAPALPARAFPAGPRRLPGAERWRSGGLFLSAGCRRSGCLPARPRVPGRGVRCLYAGYSRNSFSSAFPLFPGGSRTARVCLKKPNKTKQKNPKPNRKPDQKNNTRILFPARLLPDIPARSAEGAGLRGGRAPRRRRRRWGRGAAAGAAAARGCRASAARPAPGAALLVCS